MPQVIDYGNKVVQGIGEGLAGAGMANELALKQDREAEEDAQRGLFNDARIRAMGMQEQVMQAELDEVANVEEQRKEMAARIQGLAEDGLFGERGEEIMAIIPGIISGEVDPGEIMELTTQAQTDAKRIAKPKMERAAAVGQIADMLAADPNNAELQDILLDVQTGVVEPAQGRLSAMVLHGKLGDEFEALVQGRVDQAIADLAPPERSAEFDAAIEELAPKIEDLGQAVRRIGDMPKKDRGELIKGLADDLDAGTKSAAEVFQRAIDAGIDTNDPALVEAVKKERLKRSKKERGDTRDRAEGVKNLRSAIAWAARGTLPKSIKSPSAKYAYFEKLLREWAAEGGLHGDGDGGEGKETGVPDITDEEIATILRQVGIEDSPVRSVEELVKDKTKE